MPYLRKEGCSGVSAADHETVHTRLKGRNELGFSSSGDRLERREHADGYLEREKICSRDGPETWVGKGAHPGVVPDVIDERTPRLDRTTAAPEPPFQR